jgi:hypothetical protein
MIAWTASSLRPSIWSIVLHRHRWFLADVTALGLINANEESSAPNYCVISDLSSEVRTSPEQLEVSGPPQPSAAVVDRSFALGTWGTVFSEEPDSFVVSLPLGISLFKIGKLLHVQRNRVRIRRP